LEFDLFVQEGTYRTLVTTSLGQSVFWGVILLFFDFFKKKEPVCFDPKAFFQGIFDGLN